MSGCGSEAETRQREIANNSNKHLLVDILFIDFTLQQPRVQNSNSSSRTFLFDFLWC